MPPKIIKLGIKDDVTAAIRHIKSLKDREVIFDIEDGSPLLRSSESLKLIKKTGEVLGKTVKIQTNDENGRLIAQKAGVLYVDEEMKGVRLNSRVARSDIKPRFSDIMIPRSAPKPAAPIRTTVSKTTAPVTRIRPAAPKYEVLFSKQSNESGSRLEIELDKTSSKFSKIFILVLVVIVFAVFGLAVLLPKAQVTIFARSEPISRDFELTVDRAVPAPDANSLQIPGIAVAKSVSLTKSFSTTGTKVSGTKASGTVTIYNTTGNVLKLKASTTTLTANGKKFLLASDVSGLKANSQPTTGIEIVAANGGADSNLPANTRFTITNAALGNQIVYAINPAALTGGTTGASTKILSQEDFDNAANNLITDIISQASSDLSDENGTKIVLLDSGVRKDILAKTANKNVGDETDAFDMTMIAKVTGLGFKEENLLSVMLAKINQVLSSDKYLVEGAQKQYTPVFKTTDQNSNRGVLDVHFETEAAYRVDANNLSKILAGKNESEIKEILLSKPEIDNVQVKFWPEWFVHKAPKFNGKIYIDSQLAPSK